MRTIRAALAFSAATLRQMLRDRSALFFMLVLPVAVIVIVGTTTGEQRTLRLGVVSSPGDVSDRLEVAMTDAGAVEVLRYGSVADLQAAVRRFTVSAGLVVPADADERWVATGQVEISVVQLGASDDVVTVRRVVDGLLDSVDAPLTAAWFAAQRSGSDVPAALGVADALDRTGAGGSVEVTVVDLGGGAGAPVGAFSRTAPQNMVLFTFISSLTSATLLVRARRTGLLRRALASPSPLGLQLLGMAIGWFALALTQSLLIVVIGRVAFDVHWGDPVAGALLVVLFAIVGCGAGLLVGALGSNEDRVGATTPVVGICIGAIGGCTVPLEVFPSSMRALARVTPHYWAIDAWESLIDDGASVADIGGNLAVLGGFAIVMLVAATWSMRRALVRM